MFFFKQKTAYEMRISDWSSDVCSSDLAVDAGEGRAEFGLDRVQRRAVEQAFAAPGDLDIIARRRDMLDLVDGKMVGDRPVADRERAPFGRRGGRGGVARDEPLDEKEDADELDIGRTVLAGRKSVGWGKRL